jgi:hypothetical protein
MGPVKGYTYWVTTEETVFLWIYSENIFTVCVSASIIFRRRFINLRLKIFFAVFVLCDSYVHSNKLIIRHDICINMPGMYSTFLNSVGLRHTCHTFTIVLRNTYGDGFGGLVVSMLVSGSRVRGFDPDRSRWIFFRCEKILSMPSFGGEVK